MTTVDPFLLTLTLIMVILLIVGNIYLVAHYSHHADSAFGSSTAIKTVIVLNLIFYTDIGCVLYICLMLNASPSIRCWQL